MLRLRAMSIGPLLCFLLASFAAAEIKVEIKVVPQYLAVRQNNTMNFTVSCTAKEESYRYRRYGRDTSRVLTRLRILARTEEYGPWQPMAQVSNQEPSLVFVDPAFPNVNSVGTISSDMLARESGLAVKWVGPTFDAVKRFRCDAITYDIGYSESGSYHFSDTRIHTERLNSYSLAQLSDLEKISSIKKINASSAKMDENTALETQASAISKTRAEVDEMLKRMKLRLEEAKRTQSIRIEKMTQILNVLLAQALENQTGGINSMDSALDTAVQGSFLMLWPKGTYAIPMPSTGCPSTRGQYWKEGTRRHHTESIQRNEDEVSPGNHLRQPVLHRRGQKFFLYERFCVKTENDNFGPAWPRGSYCINAASTCPADFRTGFITWDEEDFRSEATSFGEMPSGTFEESKTRLRYCCREDGEADEAVDMPRFQPFYLYRYKGKCQQVVGMNVTEEYIHFDSENSNNGDKAELAHPDVELDDVVLHLCYYEQA